MTQVRNTQEIKVGDMLYMPLQTPGKQYGVVKLIRKNIYYLFYPDIPTGMPRSLYGGTYPVSYSTLQEYIARGELFTVKHVPPQTNRGDLEVFEGRDNWGDLL